MNGNTIKYSSETRDIQGGSFDPLFGTRIPAGFWCVGASIQDRIITKEIAGWVEDVIWGAARPDMVDVVVGTGTAI